MNARMWGTLASRSRLPGGTYEVPPSKRDLSWAATALIAGIALVVVAVPARAQRAEDSGARETLKWTADLTLPTKATTHYLAFEVTPEVFGKSKANLADLRIFDASGEKVPFAIRVLATRIEQRNVPIAREFDKPDDGDRIALELQDPSSGYNEIELDTTGTDFRRSVEVYGAKTSDFKQEQKIVPAKGKERYIVHYDTPKGVIDIRRVDFDVQTYPFLRIVVHADAGNFEDRPKINKVTVRRATAVKGKYLKPQAVLTGGGQVRGDGGPGTAWFIDLGNQMPCEGLSIRVLGAEVDRPLRLEFAKAEDEKQDVFPIARPVGPGVEWRWRHEGDKLFLDASFEEVPARKFRLVITDFDNPPLQLDFNGVTYKSAVRQVIFERPEKGFAELLRLYVGNDKTPAPHYDIENKLPATITPPPAEVQVGGVTDNPTYVPPPEPLHEKMPWLVYIILGAACLVLVGILAVLGKEAIARAGAAAPGVNPS